MRTRFQAAALVTTAVLWAAPLTLRAAEAPAGDVANGRKLYVDFGCWQCHGTTGAGGGWQGAKLAPNPLPFVAFLNQIRKPRGQMPHYAAHLLNDQATADIHAFLASIPSGRSAAQIDLLKR